MIWKNLTSAQCLVKKPNKKNSAPLIRDILAQIAFYISLNMHFRVSDIVLLVPFKFAKTILSVYEVRFYISINMTLPNVDNKLNF